MPNALITGSGPRSSDVAAALRSGGFRPIWAQSGPALLDCCAAIVPQSLDCYVQLPNDEPPAAAGLAEGSAMVAAGELARFDAVTAVAPLLSGTATVVLVLEDRSRAGDDLTRLLARALRHDYRATSVNVAVVEEGRTPSQIATIARHGGEHQRAEGSYIDFMPERGFADWRHDLLSLLPPALARRP